MIEKTKYQGWNSYRVSNGEVELMVTEDIGPRIMRFGFVGGQNLFKEFEQSLGTSGEPKWLPRGGHRLWAAPEDPVKTYAPDNGPVTIEIAGETLIATEPVEEITGLEKRITVKMSAAGAVEVMHRLRNAASASVELAPWSLTMMAPGGTGIHGFPPRGTHPKDLNPTNPLVMSAYTDLSDPRWRFTKKYMMLRQDPNATSPQKLGSWNRNTFGAYLLGSDLFIKRHEALGEPRDYPDLGCSFETFTNAAMLELETLGPMTVLAPGASVEHVERWSLHRNVRMEAWTDEELDRVLLPLVLESSFL
jgi:hypothetical protein